VESIDDLIRKYASRLSAKLLVVASHARTEEDVKIATENVLALFRSEAGITLEGKHEFTVASGRVDSVYDRVIVEYKNPSV
jgi:hypothetical protein